MCGEVFHRGSSVELSVCVVVGVSVDSVLGARLGMVERDPEGRIAMPPATTFWGVPGAAACAEMRGTSEGKPS